MLGTLSALSGLLTIICYALVVQTLKVRHKPVWELAGAPGRLFDPTQLSSQQMVGFIHKLNWWRMGDWQLNFLCIGYFFFEFAMLLSFAAAVTLS